MRHNDRTPCYKCENRSAICHSICDLYKEWRAKLDEKLDEQWEARQRKSATYPVSIEKKRRNSRY